MRNENSACHWNGCYSSGEKTKIKEPPVKKKKQAEELVDRVFRKTGGGFGVRMKFKQGDKNLSFIIKTCVE